MRMIHKLIVVVVLFATAIPCSIHAQTNALLSVQVSTNGFRSWETIQTLVTNAPATLQAFYRTQIVLSSAPAVPTTMALIRAASFSMGDSFSEGNTTDSLPVHTVNVSQFYMDKYEVSKALWEEVATWARTNGYAGSFWGNASGKAANHPVQNVTWHDAVKWCNARSEKEGLMPCYTVSGATFRYGVYDTVECNFSANGYRLPTEAEWEKAARGGLSGKRFPWGDTISQSQANYFSGGPFEGSPDVNPTVGYHPAYYSGPGNIDLANRPYTSPVGSFAPNGYGLYDMAGNVHEWCWDWYNGNYYANSPSSDPRGPVSGYQIIGRVYRGGSWIHGWRGASTATRGYDEAGIYYDWLGFRCARSSVP